MISGFSHEVDENCILLCYYAASGGNSLPMLQDSLSVPSSRVKNPKKKVLTLEDGIDRLTRNVRKELPLFAA